MPQEQKKSRMPQIGEAVFCIAYLIFDLTAAIIFFVNANGSQALLGMETAYIADLRHKLGTESRANPKLPITTGYSGSDAARDCISFLSAASAVETARSWDTA